VQSNGQLIPRFTNMAGEALLSFKHTTQQEEAEEKGGDSKSGTKRQRGCRIRTGYRKPLFVIHH